MPDLDDVYLTEKVRKENDRLSFKVGDLFKWTDSHNPHQIQVGYILKLDKKKTQAYIRWICKDKKTRLEYWRPFGFLTNEIYQGNLEHIGRR